MNKLNWFRWFLFRLPWRLLIALIIFLASPRLKLGLTVEQIALLRDSCIAVIVASMVSWANHIGRRNELRGNVGLFGVRHDK